ncbi:hypothetical protein ACFQ0K_10405 [Nocardioides caeni]|uniref:ESX secretion-associated protein EspG n=1 Tax=Nocardioides caeni TaxID=574700 RepID=A0A4S8N0Q3_9ACTN|nr:hypothetical protein [Nocardioides caeni]THV09317.1 hypothetical protein E9934_16375 [Nocardioides caeni]
MPTIDLTGTDLRDPRATGGSGDSPRRLGLTLPELRAAAALAGDAPLPFDVADPVVADGLQARLGSSPATTDDQAYRAVLAALHDPAGSLERRGLVIEGGLDPGLAGALGLLATPRIALDLDVRIVDAQARSWHRSRDGAAAALSTADGIVFEIAWFATSAWADELARVGALPDGIVCHPSGVPPLVDLPFELADAAAEAVQTGRTDLLPALAARHTGAVRRDGRPLSDQEVVRLLVALSGEARGRLRALVADVAADGAGPAAGTRVDAVGVVSWTLLADGWHALSPHRVDGESHLQVAAVEPGDLAAAIAPALAPLVGPGLLGPPTERPR